MEKLKVLVVDDDDITRSFLGDILEHEGYETFLAENGVRAQEILRSTVPDLIISDVMMPEMNGLELFHRLQEEDRLQHVPYIFLTALDDGEALIRMKELGPDDYLTKPVRPRDLLATVKGKLRRKQRREEQAERVQVELRDRIRWTLSHELRTPLTIIQGISELLLSEGPTALATDYQELLQNLRSQSFQLGSLIENFLLVTRIDAGVEEENWRTKAAACPIKEVLEEAVFPWLERTRARNGELDCAVPPDLPPVKVYRPHLLEVLKQVLDNAFKFADALRPCVRVRACLEGQFVAAVVADNGQGLTESQRKLVFQKLSQVDREIHEQQGSGLGLYIAKKLVDLNRGTIAFRDAPKSGAEIEIRVPVALPPAG